MLTNERIEELSGRLFNAQEATSDLFAYMSMTNLSTAEQLFKNIILSENIKKQNVEILDSRKTEFTDSFTMIASKISSLQTKFTTIKDAYDNTQQINNTSRTLAQIGLKKDVIKAMVPACTNPVDVLCGCRSDYYKVVCDVLDELYNNLNSNQIKALNT